ncbi:unnamed protein product, partial [Lymnaea stagnalis]
GLQSVSRRNTIKKLNTFFWAVCVLSPILGTSYVFGITSFFKDVPAAHFVFIGLNGGQGLLILIFDCLCQKDVRSGLYELYKRVKSRQLHSARTRQLHSARTRQLHSARTRQLHNARTRQLHSAKTQAVKKEKSTARKVKEETHL